MKIKWRNTIRAKVSFVYIPAITLILIILSISFNNMIENESVQQSTNLCSNTLKNINATLDSKLQLADDYRYILHSDDIMMEALAQILPIDQRTNYNQYMFQSNIRKSLVNYSNTSSFVDSFYLYSYKGETLFSSKNKYFILNNIDEDACSLLQAYNQALDEKWVVYNGQKQYDEKNELLVISFQPLYDFKTNEKLGVCSINIDMQSIVDEISTHTSQEDMNIFITDSFGTYINPPSIMNTAIHEFVADKNGSGHEIITLDSHEYLITYITSDYTRWTFFAMVPLSTVLSSTTYVNNVVILVYLIILVSFFVTAFAGNLYFYKPLKSIFNAMKKVESGDLTIQIDSQRKDEVGYIIYRFNQTLSRLNKQIQENYIDKLLLREAQLINVYSQIDEHFLYNTLDSIKWAATYCEPSTISQIVVTLSKYYRLCLSEGKDIITVRESIAQVEAYLQINEFRLHDKLQYTIDVDEKALDFLIIKYILQPLVENCVVHGISKGTQNGHISIYVKYKPDTLHFTISDNGVGIESAKLKDINNTIKESNTEKTKYFALHTVNLLLRTFYSENYWLHIESNEGAGTTYWFEIPLQSHLEGDS